MADPFEAATSLTGILGDIFGSVGSTSGTTSGTAAGERRERLDISDEAIDKIIRDVLGGPDGLASIFAGEQNAGVFNSSVSAQAAGDISANIIGEIAKIRSERIVTQTQEQAARSDAKQEDGGLIGAIGNLFGF